MKRVELMFHTLASQYAHANVPDEIFAGGDSSIRNWLTHNFSEAYMDEMEANPIDRNNFYIVDIWVDCAEDI